MLLFSQTERCFADPADLAACRALLSNGSKSFHAASFFLPKNVRQPASALYAFCRIADDAIDCREDQDAALAELHQRLERIYVGEPEQDPVDRAFAGAVKRFHMPKELPLALLDGFAWDAEGRSYETISGVLDYSARVAAAVGAMMTALMGVRAPNVLARACDLGSAMQLTNICRDVGEDARNGRIYLPLEWLRDAGIDPEAFLANPRYTPALGDVVKRVLDLAETLYGRAETGIAKLPVGCRPGIYAARLLYAEIGHEVARNGYDSVSQRAVVSGKRKLALLSQAIATTPFPGRDCDAEALSENRFLIDAVASAPKLPGCDATGRPSIGAKVGWVLDLFETLEERERRDRDPTGSIRATSIGGTSIDTLGGDLLPATRTGG
jgi:phytoene synthase